MVKGWGVGAVQRSSFTSVEAKSDSESSRYRLEEAESPLEYDRIPRKRVRQSCPARFSHCEELTSQKRAESRFPMRLDLLFVWR